MNAFARFFGLTPRMVWGVPEPRTRIVYDNPVERGLIRNPYDLPIDNLTIRVVWGRDHLRVERVRGLDRDWLQPWEATLPATAKETLPTIGEYQRRSDAEVEAGLSLPMMIELDGKVVGLVTAANTVRGAMYCTTVGYWIISDYAGLGITSLAVASVIDLLILELGMHRVEINIRPENEPSLGLVRKLGLREEGYKKNYMQIAGHWADHIAFAIDEEDLPSGGLVNAIWGEKLK